MAVFQIAASNRDAQETAGTVVINGSTNANDLDETTDWLGMSFLVTGINSGETITSCFITVQPTGSGNDEPDVTIFGEAADNSAVFTTAASSISSRSRTTASVAWSNADLGSTGSQDFDTSSLVTIAQEIINRPGWVAGNAMTFLWQGSATLTRDLSIKLFDGAGGAAAAPRLTIVADGGATTIAAGRYYRSQM